MKIAIIGMMGSGKTEIGTILAARMNLNCVDLDAYIEQSVHVRVVDIFKQWGESRFRDMEADTLSELSASPRDFVLCCGGGAVLRASNREILKHRFLTVWLDVPIEELARRLMDQRAGRPLLQEMQWEKKLETIYQDRLDMYQSSAQIHYIWKEGQDARESATEIEKLILRAAAIQSDHQE